MLLDLTSNIWLTYREAAQEFKLTPVELRGLVMAGRVRLEFRGSVKRFSRSDILRCLTAGPDGNLGLFVHLDQAQNVEELGRLVEEAEATEVSEALGGGDEWRDYSNLWNGSMVRRGDLDRWVRDGRVRVRDGCMYYWPDVERELSNMLADRLREGR